EIGRTFVDRPFAPELARAHDIARVVRGDDVSRDIGKPLHVELGDEAGAEDRDRNRTGHRMLSYQRNGERSFIYRSAGGISRARVLDRARLLRRRGNRAPTPSRKGGRRTGPPLLFARRRRRRPSAALAVEPSRRFHLWNVRALGVD